MKFANLREVHYLFSTIYWLFIVFAALSGVFFCIYADASSSWSRSSSGTISSIFPDFDEFFENQELSDDNQDPTERARNHGCPDLLVLDNGEYKLYFSTAKEVDGVNPRVFYSLDEYTRYQKKQDDEQDRACPPPLFSRAEIDAQGNQVFRFYPTPHNIEGGLPPLPLEVHNNRIPIPYIDASRENAPYNDNLYAGFDPAGFDQGRFNFVDVIHQSTERINQQKRTPSENPMDPNWGGVEYSMVVAAEKQHALEQN